MSQTVVLACPSGCNLDILAPSVERTGTSLDATFWRDDREAQFVGPNHRYYVTVTESSDQDGPALEYEENEDLDAQFRKDALELHYYYVRFNDFFVARRALRALLADVSLHGFDIWVDTNYGWVIRGSEAVRLMDQDPEWDWRHQAPSSGA